MLKKFVLVLAVGGVVVTAPAGAGEPDAELSALLEKSVSVILHQRNTRRDLCPRTPNPRACEADFDEDLVSFIVVHAEQLSAMRDKRKWSCESSVLCHESWRRNDALWAKYARYDVSPPTQ